MKRDNYYAKYIDFLQGEDRDKIEDLVFVLPHQLEVVRNKNVVVEVMIVNYTENDYAVEVVCGPLDVHVVGVVSTSTETTNVSFLVKGDNANKVKEMEQLNVVVNLTSLEDGEVMNRYIKTVVVDKEKETEQQEQILPQYNQQQMVAVRQEDAGNNKTFCEVQIEFEGEEVLNKRQPLKVTVNNRDKRNFLLSAHEGGEFTVEFPSEPITSGLSGTLDGCYITLKNNKSSERNCIVSFTDFNTQKPVCQTIVRFSTHSQKQKIEAKKHYDVDYNDFFTKPLQHNEEAPLHKEETESSLVSLDLNDD
ncbi:hypothetical protein EIN_092050 [Entamoeba invadens IP1]|uniref:Uncharacterized protein n=1 Tax=Entamoeba invadens IP1 TaxID=370355 RepID=A0A0A1U4K4_ENTIV|nr:hypothetical protein EIN_092050 [Entamoeba invadens IP1]ELP86640.1 hypothetical protein EIN_092050 [Entamoeba invadens IP1]|eukprot:XP_004185986.1 hypothetical protein EIN_092050 [Entamoeba invadens IP1]